MSGAGDWAFTKRFRHGGFGWRASRLASERIAEALAEIRAVARHDPLHAADGAVRFLVKPSPALEQVDSSSGALGNAARAAVEALVPVIAQAPADEAMREKWLEQLFEAIQNDDPPYLDLLDERWGDLCATPEVASRWADRLMDLLRPPVFAAEVALAALHWICQGRGYALTSLDVQIACRLASEAGLALGQSDRVALRIQTMLRPTTREVRWV